MGTGVSYFILWKALRKRRQPHMQASACIHAFPPTPSGQTRHKTEPQTKLQIQAAAFDSSASNRSETRRLHPRQRKPGHLHSECSKQGICKKASNPCSHWQQELRVQLAAKTAKHKETQMNESKEVEDSPDRVTRLCQTQGHKEQDSGQLPSNMEAGRPPSPSDPRSQGTRQ